MKYRIVQTIENRMIATEVEDIFAWLEVQDKMWTYNANRNHRPELIGQPVFDGFLGPMWDGDAIRYEDPETYRRLSI
jgi:hypothetical protein